MDIEEVRRSKSTEIWKHLRAQGRKWLYHFTKVTNVAPLLATRFCCHGLAAYRSFFNLAYFSLCFPFLNLYFFHFERKIFFIFRVQFKAVSVCILHILFGWEMMCFLCQKWQKQQKKRVIWIQEDEKKTSTGRETVSFESLAGFIMWILLRMCRGWSSLTLAGKTKSPFLQRCIFTAENKSKAHSLVLD